MALKTIRALRVPKESIPSVGDLAKVARQYEARECKAQEEKHWGFRRFEGRGNSDEAFVIPLHNSRWRYFEIALNKRILPGPVVKKETEKRAKKLGQARGEALSNKEKRELKEEVKIDLLAKSFQREHIYPAIFDVKEQQLWLDATSDSIQTDILRLIRRGLGSLPVTPVLADNQLPSRFAAWIAGNDDLPGVLRIGGSAKAIDPDEPKATVTLSHEELMNPDIQRVLESRMIKQLALENDHMTAVLTDAAVLKSVKVTVDMDDAEADPDHMKTLFCMEVREFLNDLESEIGADGEPESLGESPEPVHESPDVAEP
ncbi:MAG: Recombination associated protein [Marinobacter sp. T13-3]|nr:MAG: Recombination associated protein [Marinobacter sp. T13-3]